MAKKDLDLADILAGELNKSAKDQKVAFFLDSDEAPTNVEGWISTGCAMLDVAISNRPYVDYQLVESQKLLVWNRVVNHYYPLIYLLKHKSKVV